MSFLTFSRHDTLPDASKTAFRHFSTCRHHTLSNRKLQFYHHFCFFNYTKTPSAPRQLLPSDKQKATDDTPTCSLLHAKKLLFTKRAAARWQTEEHNTLSHRQLRIIENSADFRVFSFLSGIYSLYFELKVVKFCNFSAGKTLYTITHRKQRKVAWDIGNWQCRKNASEETHLPEPLKQCSDDKNFHTNHSSSFVNFTFNVFPPSP